MSKFTPDYQNFFLKSEAGKQFLDFIVAQVSSEMEKAKKNPAEARDRVQTINGLEAVTAHIDSVCHALRGPKE